MRIVTWNVDGLKAMLNRRQEALPAVLKQLNAGNAPIVLQKIAKMEGAV